jgi:hypothetical protein
VRGEERRRSDLRLRSNSNQDTGHCPVFRGQIHVQNEGVNNGILILETGYLT